MSYTTPSDGAADVSAASDAVAGLHAALVAAIAQRTVEVERLSYAMTSVSFGVEGADRAVMLYLDRRPPEVAIGPEDPAEIRIVLSLAQARDLADGALCMPAAICASAVRFNGPVRKYLEVDPIVRKLINDTRGTGRLAAPSIAGGDMRGEVDSDLLAIETRDLSKSFGSAEILQGVNLRVPEGTISCVLGPSGTGKSVLLQHIIGLLEPDGGDIIIRGRPLSGMSRSQILDLRTEIGVMFQDGALFSAMNVEDNVAFPLRQHTNLSDRDIREVVGMRLEEVGLSAAATRMPAELSGGMKKRAGLARALVLEPSIVLCDEPDSGLDPVRTALLGELLAEQHACTGGTMVIITHNIALAKRVSDHISVLWRGEVVAEGLSADMLGSDDEFVRQFLSADTIGPLGMDA